MHNVTFISTIHNDIGNCNSDELSNIIGQINPEVIFLEALENTYSKYDKLKFSTFGVYHEKLEISAIQKHLSRSSFYYVPVLDTGLSDAFETKYNEVGKYLEFRRALENFNSLSAKHGFKFLNSAESIRLQEEMRALESHLINNENLEKKFYDDIDTYENSMINNIYSYSNNNSFNSAIFMCGVAHRKSIINKLKNLKDEKLNWTIFGT